MSLLRLLISFSHRPAELAVDVARQGSMNDFSQPVEVSLGRQGRLVIPAALRRELGFEEGDALVARQELGRLVLEKPEPIKKRLKQRFSEVPAERKLVEELIAERREESRRDAAE
jgi:AbrB family looped-hinge helix DNA binding protein